MIAEQLNPEAREIVIMPEQTLLKHVEEILEKKLEQDERRPSGGSSNNATKRTDSAAVNMALATGGFGGGSAAQMDVLTFAYYHFLS